MNSRGSKAFYLKFEPFRVPLRVKRLGINICLEGCISKLDLRHKCARYSFKMPHLLITTHNPNSRKVMILGKKQTKGNAKIWKSFKHCTYSKMLQLCPQCVWGENVETVKTRDGEKRGNKLLRDQARRPFRQCANSLGNGNAQCYDRMISFNMCC